jgi:hypothetical protein
MSTCATQRTGRSMTPPVAEVSCRAVAPASSVPHCVTGGSVGAVVPGPASSGTSYSSAGRPCAMSARRSRPRRRPGLPVPFSDDLDGDAAASPGGAVAIASPQRRPLPPGRSTRRSPPCWPTRRPSVPRRRVPPSLPSRAPRPRRSSSPRRRRCRRR